MRLSKTPVLFLLLLLSFETQAQLFPIKKNKKWGLMNADGRIVQQPVYDAIGEFKQFGYAVMQREGKVGMLNSQGREIVPPKYKDLKTLDSMLISVLEESSWKVINLEGRIILQPGYERVEVLTSQNLPGKVPTRITPPNTSPLNNTGTPQSSEAHQRYASTSYLAFMVDKKWGLVDGQGKVIAVPRYDEITILEEVSPEVEGVFFQTRIDGQAGLLLDSGFEVLSPQAEEIRVFDERLIFFKKYRKWGAVSFDGKEMLKPAYEHFSRVSDHFLRLTADKKGYLFSLRHYALLSNVGFEAFYPFSDDYALCKHDRLLGLMDHCGKLVLDTKYNEIQVYDEDIFRANLKGKWGIVTLDDTPLLSFEYDYVAPLRQGFSITIQNRRMGIANYRGELVVQPAFDRIELDGTTAKAYEKEKLTVFNFDEQGQLQDQNNFSNHFTIKITKGNEPALPNWTLDENPYLLEKFEWFYSPKDDRWGLRRLDNGQVQIEPTFNEVRVEKSMGMTLVGIEMRQELDFDRTSFRFEMAYGLVKNDTGLLVHEVDLVDIRLQDFELGLPVARCIFLNGKHGLVSRIGKIIGKDYAFIGHFSDGVARMTLKGKLSTQLANTAQLPKLNHLGRLRDFFNDHLSPISLADYTQHDLDVDNRGWLTCEGCAWGYVDTLGQIAVQPNYTFARDFMNEVGIVATGELWGMVDNKGKILLPCRYDELGFLEDTGNKVLRVFKKEEKYGLIDTLGRLKVSVQYENIGSFSEGRLAVKRQGLWGFVDPNGREVVPCRFDEVSVFGEGWAAVRLGSKWGYIDKNGNVELDFQFSKAGRFGNGLAPVKKEAPFFGYIDRKGEWVIQPRFPKAAEFDRGVARIEEMSGDYFRTGLIDISGNYIVKPKFVSLSAFDQHGLAVAGIGGSPMKYGLVNLQGQIITPQTYREIVPFSEGLARVQGKDGYGFIDTNGALVVPARFFKASDFSEGKAAIWLDGQCGFIDTGGNVIIEPQFSRCMDFRDGKAIVFKGNQRAGLIDSGGNFVIEPGINRLLDFAGGRGLVRDEHYQFYYITEQARFYDGFYQKAGQFRHGVAVVQIEGRWAIINQQGIEIIPPKYDKIEQFEDGFAKVRIKGFNGLTNLRGELIVQPDYEYISYAGEGLFRVEQGDKVGYFDMEGKWVWGLQE
jgi:hypothetical protein